MTHYNHFAVCENETAAYGQAQAAAQPSLEAWHVGFFERMNMNKDIESNKLIEQLYFEMYHKLFLYAQSAYGIIVSPRRPFRRPSGSPAQRPTGSRKAKTGRADLSTP